MLYYAKELYRDVGGPSLSSDGSKLFSLSLLSLIYFFVFILRLQKFKITTSIKIKISKNDITANII